MRNKPGVNGVDHILIPCQPHRVTSARHNTQGFMHYVTWRYMTWKYSPPFTRVYSHTVRGHGRTYSIWAAVPSFHHAVSALSRDFIFWGCDSDPGISSMKCACSCLHSYVHSRVRHRNELLFCSLMLLANTYYNFFSSSLFKKSVTLNRNNVLFPSFFPSSFEHEQHLSWRQFWYWLCFLHFVFVFCLLIFVFCFFLILNLLQYRVLRGSEFHRVTTLREKLLLVSGACFMQLHTSVLIGSYMQWSMRRRLPRAPSRGLWL